jgi:hypothetical protein
MSHWPKDLDILLYLDSYDLPCHHAPHPFYQCGVPATSVVTLLVRMMHG